MKKRVYLSGPMTGIEEFNFPAFHATASRLRAQGFDVVSPAEVNTDLSLTWRQCMRRVLAAMCDCDAIALMPGWENSNGAQLELHVAHRMGLEVIHLDRQFDLLTHLRRQADFSLRTFGPGARVDGVTNHIAKELDEVRSSGGALSEWVDVIILGFDGAWRSGATPEEIVAAIVAKQEKNERRTWPDWTTAEPGKAIEHVRAEDEAA